MIDKDKTSPCQDPLWEKAWTWVQRQHEIGFDNTAFNAQLKRWLQADPARRKAYDQASRIWSVAGLVPPMYDIPPPEDCSDPAGDGAPPAGEST